MTRTRRLPPATSFAAGSNWNSQDAKSRYERYLALARTQALSGDMMAAENYYQHAEHYFGSMSLPGKQTWKTRSAPHSEPHSHIADALAAARRRQARASCASQR